MDGIKIGDIVAFLSDRLDFEERITRGRKGEPYLVIDIKQPLSATFLVLAEHDGSPIVDAQGKPLEVHDCHLQKDDFRTAVQRRREFALRKT
jgi:hypothetical protein